MSWQSLNSSIVHIRGELQRHFSSSISTHPHSLNGFWKLLLQWQQQYLHFWGGAGESCFTVICIIVELSHHLSHITQKWKKNLTGGMPRVICMTALLHIRIIIFFNPQRTKGVIKEELSGDLLVMKWHENKLQQVSLFSCKQSKHFTISTSKALQNLLPALPELAPALTGVTTLTCCKQAGTDERRNRAPDLFWGSRFEVWAD